ncbi:NAD-dependent epimerase/dehydratase family protein [Silvimonas iriomotensis]|uniref:NAD-dependent dehydratase n=1 Tax=Silvimonas iriomotensis TaxID=449662 RepID=A0ABQ2P8H9_9NEIS|nr:NAD-dependent epimerase/dehydratase family protein [Silvimonas iriomotensis]GGP20813.1 NAD-dependent dehydratase [Silvimonas iriomotensis]
MRAKPRLLIAGCGDVVSRALPWLLQRFRVYVLCRRADQAARLRAMGAVPIMADLDHPATLSRLSGLQAALIHSVPPSTQGETDLRTRKLLSALQKNVPRQGKSAILAQPSRPAVYISTTGVYGNADGRWLDESSGAHPDSARARRRADAELQLRAWACHTGRPLAILRAPGIYAAGRLPTARIERGDPVIRPEEDSWSNHIHADDLAHAICLALFRGRPLRTYNVVDDAPSRMGDWFDEVADASKLPRPARITREQAQVQLSPAILSYLDESRRLRNERLKQELRVRLRWPTTASFFASLF